ncbi:hypothetical protein ACWDKQ_23465 [Saccharopolyspora sp. NPDC000995]
MPPGLRDPRLMYVRRNRFPPRAARRPARDRWAGQIVVGGAVGVLAEGPFGEAKSEFVAVVATGLAEQLVQALLYVVEAGVQADVPALPVEQRDARAFAVHHEHPHRRRGPVDVHPGADLGGAARRGAEMLDDLGLRRGQPEAAELPRHLEIRCAAVLPRERGETSAAASPR